MDETECFSLVHHLERARRPAERRSRSLLRLRASATSGTLRSKGGFLTPPAFFFQPVVDTAAKMRAHPPRMATEPSPEDAKRHVKRMLGRLFLVVGLSVLFVLALVFYLWEHSPKPP